jgi:hypothetical protein
VTPCFALTDAVNIEFMKLQAYLYIIVVFVQQQKKKKKKERESLLICISFNFLCYTLFYWLKNWGDFFVIRKKNLSAQTSQNTQAP